MLTHIVLRNLCEKKERTHLPLHGFWDLIELNGFSLVDRCLWPTDPITRALFKNIYVLYKLYFIYDCSECIYAHTGAHVEDWGQFVGAYFLLLSYVFGGCNSGHVCWWQATHWAILGASDLYYYSVNFKIYILVFFFFLSETIQCLSCKKPNHWTRESHSRNEKLPQRTIEPQCGLKNSEQTSPVHWPETEILLI